MKDTFRNNHTMEHPFPSNMLPQNMFVDHDPAYFPAQSSPAWLPSEGSMSDSCSGTWSPPPASVSYSPSPKPQDFHNSYLGWGLQNISPYTSLNEVQYHPDATSDYPPASEVCHQPYYQAQWQYAPQPDAQVMGGFESGGYWTSTEYSRASSEQDSQTSSPRFFKTEADMGLEEARVQEHHIPVEIKQEQKQLAQPIPLQSQQQASMPHSCSSTMNPATTAFPCPLAIYGCTSSFASKNEWKRHLNTQHLCLETWRCDLCSPKRGTSSNHPTNDFNRKDLFIQHLRRMHCAPSAPETCPHAATKPHPKSGHQQLGLPNTEAALMAAERRCHVVLRTPPVQSRCLFCNQCFRGRDSWAPRVEHVARHLENFKRDGAMVPQMENWNRDIELETWLAENGVLAFSGRGPQRMLRVALRGSSR